jgi:hypothetical protein
VPRLRRPLLLQSQGLPLWLDRGGGGGCLCPTSLLYLHPAQTSVSQFNT